MVAFTKDSASFWRHCRSRRTDVVRAGMPGGRGPGLACAATAVGVVFLTLKLLWECYPLLDLRGDTDECDIRSRQLMLGPLWRLTATRFYIGAATVGVAAVETVIASSDYLSMWLFVASGVALLTVCGELLERLLYFSSVAYERMPGTLR